MSLIPWIATNDVFDTFFDDPFFRRGALVPRQTQQLTTPLAPVLKMDLVEKEDEFSLSADLPGISKEDISINIDHDIVTVSATRTSKHNEDSDKFHYRERSFGRVERSLRLPSNADVDKAAASYENGVLQVHFPKVAKKESGKKIEIK